ncbi:C-5 sterol desaturase [Pacificimonas flava]|uniref:C-5 sterol desaturase n=2 Tax=Pacificimonas TaxID=1960290 RepID=A0A219B2E0_9SPHN|nr:MULTISPECIES: sterol desaturase family protein [Pacificimonas]MBZ6378001.1 sterol desaturase family protein [Pacificimonas aurantium]OWV32354.1 C-5 sterol desaturase [Pacificimonas flava]
MELPDPVEIAVPFFIGAMVLELLWVRLKGRSAGHYEWRDTATSLLMGFGSTVAGLLTGGMFVAAAIVISDYRIAEAGWAWWAWLLCFLADDLSYYAFHRTAHRVRWFWASHVIHHSSQHYNLSTALRQTWTGTVSLSFVFSLPLFLVFEPAMVFFCSGVNLVYQFWIHTESAKKMPAWFEAVFNTPSHHRVHHATNPRCLDRNYAGMLIIWDRLFGTFEPEPDPAEEPLRYGIVRNLGSFNPLWVAVHEWVGIAKDLWAAPTWRARWNYVAREPGWSHDGSRLTSEAIRRQAGLGDPPAATGRAPGAPAGPHRPAA